jgi:hypothetical protein
MTKEKAILNKMKKADHKKCTWSNGIHDGLTVGSGELDDYGYWQFPCYECARNHEKLHPADGPIWPFDKEYLKNSIKYINKKLSVSHRKQMRKRRKLKLIEIFFQK